MEVCCAGLEDVKTARWGGASRVELCSALEIGGVTPSPGLMAAAVREREQMKVMVLIRPRGGNFVYSREEVAVMEADIAAARAAGADGVVIGALTPSGEIDLPVIARLLAAAGDMEVTFHRAFDEVADPLASLDTLMECGIERVLTSGGEPTAWQGRSLLASLVEHSGGRIAIMPGSGVNARNIRLLRQATGAREFHSSCRGQAAESTPASRLFGENPRQADADVVREILSVLHQD